jgi:hypothetical protein
MTMTNTLNFLIIKNKDKVLEIHTQPPTITISTLNFSCNFSFTLYVYVIVFKFKELAIATDEQKFCHY